MPGKIAFRSLREREMRDRGKCKTQNAEKCGSLFLFPGFLCSRVLSTVSRWTKLSSHFTAKLALSLPLSEAKGEAEGTQRTQRKPTGKGLLPTFFVVRIWK